MIIPNSGYIIKQQKLLSVAIFADKLSPANAQLMGKEYGTLYLPNPFQARQDPQHLL